MTMRIYFARVLLAFALTASPSLFAAIVGYVNVQMQGTTLFSNPLLAESNDLASLFSSQTPEGTTISLWNPSDRSFDTSSQFLGGAWTIDLTLLPGTGARLITPMPFINTFVGTVLNHDGTILPLNSQLTPPPPFTGPDGVYLLGDKSPLVSTGNDIFLNVLGRNPNFGEQFTGSDGIVCTYLGGGGWDHTPTLTVGGAGFFNVVSVPEPSGAVLGLLAVLALRIRSKKR